MGDAVWVTFDESAFKVADYVAQGIANINSSYGSDIAIVAKCASSLLRLREEFPPPFYVRTLLVNEQTMDQVDPPRLETRGSDLVRASKRQESIIRRGYRAFIKRCRAEMIRISNASQDGQDLLEKERRLVSFQRRERVESFVESLPDANAPLEEIEAGCIPAGDILDLSEEVREEAHTIVRQIRELQNYKEIQGRVVMLTHMGCFKAVHRVEGSRLGIASGPAVFLCPERIRKSSSSIRETSGQMTELKRSGRISGLVSGKTALRTSIGSVSMDELERVYKFVFIHEHSHAALIEWRPNVPSRPRELSEGLAQWTTERVLVSSGDTDTLGLFNIHSDVASPPYRFHREMEAAVNSDVDAVRSVAYVWSQARSAYNWRAFIKSMRDQKRIVMSTK